MVARSSLRDLQRTIRTYSPGGSVLTDLLAPLARLGRMERAVAYGVSSQPDGVALEFFHDVGFGGLAPRQEFEGFLSQASSAQPWGLFRPDRPERSQRNSVLRLCDFARPEAHAALPLTTVLFRGWGIDTSDQMRVLICDGPSLLAWVGGFRSEPFTPRDVRRLTALIPALRRRLRLERRFQDEGLRKGALAAALEVLGAAAFVLDAHGSLKHANAAGQARARAEGRALRRELVEALRPGAPSRFQLVQLALVGLAPHWLAVAERPREDAAARLARATKRWALTARQSEVLALLVIRGDPNKTIAARLECAVSTVELHVTAILQKACADSRAGLAAKFWMEP